jgi:hypothetical protein
MTMDAEYERHRRQWVGFTRFITWGTGVVALVLILMALFLV